MGPIWCPCRFKSYLAFTWPSKTVLHSIGMSTDRYEISNSEQGRWRKVHVTLPFTACQTCDNLYLSRMCRPDVQRLNITIKVESFGKAKTVLIKWQFRNLLLWSPSSSNDYEVRLGSPLSVSHQHYSLVELRSMILAFGPLSSWAGHTASQGPLAVYSNLPGLAGVSTQLDKHLLHQQWFIPPATPALFNLVR